MSNGIKLSTEQECKVAAKEFLASYMGTINTPDTPTGCNWFEMNARVWLNSNQKNQRAAGVTPLCKRGNQNMLGIIIKKNSYKKNES